MSATYVYIHSWIDLPACLPAYLPRQVCEAAKRWMWPAMSLWPGAAAVSLQRPPAKAKAAKAETKS